MRNCNIARKLGVAPHNVRWAIKLFQELGRIGDSPRNDRMPTVNIIRHRRPTERNRRKEWCMANFPDFITATEWPPFSPDLNLVDYSIWSILEARICAKPHKNLVPLKQSLQRGWERLSLEELRSKALNFRKLLTLRIVADGDLCGAN